MPEKRLLKLLPQPDLLVEAAIHGLSGITSQFGIPQAQVNELYQEGGSLDPGSAAEFRSLATQVIAGELDLRRDEFTLSEYLDRMAILNGYLTAGDQSLVANEDIPLDIVTDIGRLPKWESGFSPLDTILGGCYQGILTLIAKSGSGKTSLMLSLMEAIRSTSKSAELWFYETEIPSTLMLYRMKDIRERVQFTSRDRLICGDVTSDEIVRRVKSDPNPNRVIFVDSPDVMSGGSGEGKRFAIEKIYRDLVTVKEHSALVVVASQARRKDRGITLESVAEAWVKVHYSDMVIGMTKLGRIVQGLSQVKLSVPKNRFGMADQEITFGYNYANLEWKLAEGKRANVVNTEEGEDW